MYRLREIVEFSFGNVILAIGFIPLAVALPLAVRIESIVILAYGLVDGVFLRRRQRHAGIAWTTGWGIEQVLAINIGLLGFAVAGAATSGSTCSRACSSCS